MDLGLKNKVALVSGSSSGLGEAVAKSLAAEGASIIICSIDEEGLAKVKHDIIDSGNPNVISVNANLSTRVGVDNVISAAIEKFGKVDILVSNTGGPPSTRFENTTPEQWQSAVDLLLMSAVNLTRGILPGMMERKWGRIIYCTSIAVKQPVENLVLSNSVRASVTGLAKTLASEIAASGITVNCVLPGYTRTQRLTYLANATAEQKGISIEEAWKQWTNEIPMGRVGEPHEFGDTVTFLASEKASFITGQSLAVDGGWIKSLL
jgi:3-oxoacyl-[acyl-carrier protein] reductase